ncbi:hypothetical protein GCM10009735_18480 [Actinomadura chokoriensis]
MRAGLPFAGLDEFAGATAVDGRSFRTVPAKPRPEPPEEGEDGDEAAEFPAADELPDDMLNGLPALSVRPAETEPDGSAGLAHPAEPEEDDGDDDGEEEAADFAGAAGESAAVSLTGAISEPPESFAGLSSIFARSIRVVSALDESDVSEEPGLPAVSEVSRSTVVSSRAPDLADAAATVFDGFVPDLDDDAADDDPDPDPAPGFLPEPPVPLPAAPDAPGGPPLFLPGSVLTCPPGLAAR